MLKKMLSMLMAVTMLVTCFPAGAVSAVSPEEETVDVIQTEPEDIPQETPEEDPTEAEETDPTDATDPPAVTDPVDIPDETEIAEATTAPAEPSAPIDNPKATKATATSGTTGKCTWQLNGTELTISGNGAMGNYVSYDAPPWGTSITKVIIQHGATSIGDYAFYNCSSLISITIPDSVTSIGVRAFSGCSSLPNITIPDSVISIGNYAFDGCSNLTSVNIPESITSIDSNVFSGCNKIQFNTYDNARYLGNATNPYFALISYIHSSITSCVIHPDTKIIADYAFYNCSMMRTVTIGDNVTRIGSSAFSNCHSLTRITIPSSVTSIGSNALGNYNNFTCNTYNGGRYLGNDKNPYVVLIKIDSDISTYQIHQDTKVIYQSACSSSSLTSITIPDGVTCIGEGAFRECTGLTRVTIPDSVTSIGEGAFRECTGLTSVTIGNGVTNIGDCAFLECTSLSKVTLGDNLTNIGGMAFFGCKKIYSINLPESLISIGYDAFNYCTNLYYVTIPNGVTDIGSGAFSGCRIKSITIPAGVTKIHSYLFSGCSNLSSISILGDVTSIGEAAFYNCSSLTDIVIPNTVTQIGKRAFGSCSKLTDITIPEGVNTIYDHTFYECSSLTTVTVGSNLSRIEEYAFYGCNKLQYHTYSNGLYLGNPANPYVVLADTSSTGITTIQIHNNTKVIQESAFENCSNLTNITIPNGITDIGNYAFKNCSKLTDIIVPDSVIHVGNGAFSGCSGLQTMTIPFIGTEKNGVYPFGIIFGTASYNGGTATRQYHGSWSSSNSYTYYIPTGLKSVVVTGGELPFGAFFNCSNLTSVTIPDDVTRIEDYAFYYCRNLTSVTIPDGVTSIGRGAFIDCYGLTAVYITDLKAWCEIGFADSASNPVCYAKKLYLKGELVTDLVIPKGITNINNYTFYNCGSLTSVTIPNSILDIGEYALSGCSGLTNITIPDSIKSLGKGAFSGCSGLTSITIPESVDSIGEGVLSKSINLESVTIPFVGGSRKTAEDTYQYPFGYIFGTASYTGGKATTQYYYGDSTSSTISVTYYIPTSLKSVTVTGGNVLYGAFYNCSSLTSIAIPNSVTSVGKYAFYGCSSLTGITIPASVTSIGDYAFRGCENLTGIWVNKNNACFSSDSYGVLFDYNKTKLIQAPALMKGAYTVPASVTSIGSSAFENCGSLTSVTIPDSVTSIGGSAFENCGSLTSVTIGDSMTSVTNPDSVTSIGSSAFYNCSSLTSVTIGDSVTSIGSYAFYNCSSLTNIVIPDSVTSIGDSVLARCSSLTNIVIPDSVTSIGDSVLAKCSGLTEITIPFVGPSRKTVSDTYQYPFGYFFGTNSYTGGTATTQNYYGSSTSSTTSATYYIPASLKSVTVTGGNVLYGAFYNCSSLTSVTITDGITNIGSSAFYCCSSLTSITIPDSVTSIGNGAFSGCNKLVYNIYQNGKYLGNNENPYVVLAGVVSVNAAAFSIHENTKVIRYWALANCTKLTEIVIPESVASIGVQAFYNCSSLTSVTIGAGVTSIGSSAFSGCSRLTSITIPNGVASIGAQAFYNCSRLTSVVIPDSVTSIGKGIFSGCGGLTSITIPFVGDSRKTATNINQYPFGYFFGTTSYTGSTATTQYYYGSSTSSTTSTTYYIPTSLKSVTVTSGNILYGAFSYCSNLKSVTIGNNVTYIGATAFNGCSSLTDVYISDISTWCAINFSNATANPMCYADNLYVNGKLLTDLVIPDGVTSIGRYAFYNCISLTSITIPDSVTSIGEGAFRGCGSLQSMTIPFAGGSRKTEKATYQYPFGYIFGSSSYTGGTYTSQRYYGSSTSSTTSTAYYIPTSLKSVTVTGGNLLYGAFYNCTNLTTITIGKDVLNVNKDAFIGCTGLERIEVSEENPNYCSVNGILYNKDKTEIIWAPANQKLKLQVNYLYVNGETAGNSVSVMVKAGESYSVEIPEIPGYSTKENSITGTMPAEDTIIDVIYYENAKQNSGQCNDNITWTLYADGMLVLRGSGEMPDYASGGAPWAADAEKVTEIYIDSRITSIGDYAFENCSKLSFVDYGYSVASIGQYAFSGCSSLTSFKLPESVTVVSAGAFSGCAGLKAVVIPDNITAVGNNAFAGCSELIQVTIGGAVTEIGDGAFSDCKALTQIYFRGEPVTLGSNALGSTNGKFVYYYSTVSGWEQEIVDGKWHGYEAIPYNAIAKENFDGTNVYIIKVVDKHNISLKNAVVTLGDETKSTNNDGMAYFVKPTQAQALKIECSNHITFTDEAFVATKTQLMDVIELSDKPSVVQGVRMNGDSIATSVGVLNCLSGETVKITVSGYSKYAIFQYELYQGDRLIATEKTSANSCTFTVKAESFEEGQNVLVRMHTVDGNSVASALNIDVIRLASISEEQILGELSGIELAIGFGGMGNYKIPLNLESAGKEKIYTIIDGRSIKVGINLDFDLIKDEKDEKKAKTFLHKMVDDAMKNTKKGKAGLTYNLCGYIEIEYLGNNEYCIKSSYVKMAIGAELSFRAQASWFGIVGVYFKVGLSGEASLDLHITHFAPEEGFQVDDMNFAMEDKLEMEGGAYILWGIGSASIYGSITMGFQVGIIPEFEMESVYMSGELGVKWSLLWGLKKGNKVIAAGDFYRWPEPQRELAKKLYEAQQDPDSYTSNDRAYLENRSEWLTGDYLQTNIYDQVSPEVVTCGDTTMMVWLDDNSQRDSANYQTLYYSLYKNGAWSAPVAVDDNGTFDCEFDVYTDGRKIYVIYTELESQNAGVETLDVSDQSGIEAFVSGVEVCVAVYENGSFSAPVRLTNNNICEMLPCITSVNGKLTATWVETNAVGLNTEAGGSTVRSAVFTDNSWGQQANVADDQNMVSDIVTVCLKGQTYTAYIVDADGSGETEDDQALILKNQNGEAKQLDMGVIAQVSNCLIDNMDALTWYNNGKIYMIADPEQQPVCLVPEMTSVSSNYQIISVAQNQTLLLTVMSNEGGNGTDLYSMYVDSTGSLTSPVRLTQTEGYIGNYSVSYRDEKLMVVFTESFAEISKESINTVTHLRNVTLDFYTDITLQDVEYDITAAKPNTELELSFGVKNSGTNAVDGITVNLYDPARKLLYTTQCDVSLVSGASDTFKATVILPEKLAVDAYHIEILPQNGMAAATDTNTEDNRTELRLAYADISVEAEQKIVGEKNYLILSVANIGNTASKANIQIYAGDQTGRQIANIETGTKEEDLVEPGETEQYFVDIHALVNENDKMATCVVTSKTTDPYLLNNTDTVVLLHIREEIFVKDPDQVIRNPELSVNTGKFDKYIPQNIAVQITAEADSFRTVEGLTKGRDFTVSNGTVTISRAYLSTLAVGKHTLNFVFDFGYDLPVVRSVVVTVSDSTPIVLGGSIGISGETVVGETVYADISGLKPATVKLGCIWTVDGEAVGSDNYYAIKAADLGKTLKLTVTGGEGYTGSFTAEAVVTLKKPAAPAAPLISKVESGTVTLVKVAGMEYSRDLTAWQDSHVFTDLLPNTAYTFYARKKATAMSLASDAGAGVTVTTLKRTVAAPAAPQVESKTYNSITLAADPAMEYRMEGGGWTDNNVFTGLEPNTVYVFYQRYQETETAYASEASTASFTTLDRTPIGGTVAIEGKPYFGTELTAVLKDFTGDMESISYQWYRDGVAIDGAVNSTYTVTQDDLGKTLEIRVSGTGAYQGELTAQLEIPAYIPGDVNSDGYVNSNDVLYFLRFTLSPGRYPINQSGDMNGDGYVNSNDVLYLLRHTLSPGRYPLYG